MESRRDFLTKAAMLAAGSATLPVSIQRALAIDPRPGTTWQDAEHVVILMQENRSFDHCYGTLRGVRGFEDPRAVTLPNGNPVWLQSNGKGETSAPFRLDIKNTKATWMSSLPHGWADQIDARNEGLHDRWLDAKRSGNRAYADMPLTLGYHTREDIPFYYSLADAFTVCDQNFCSSFTGTTPNRLHLWTGTVRAEASAKAKANIRNEDVDHSHEVSWKTFPERLQEHGVSWRIYQNELSLPTGLSKAEDSWLASFGDNPLEHFTQYHVWLAPTHIRHLAAREKDLVAEIRAADPANAARLNRELETVRGQLRTRTAEHFAKLPAREQALHHNAFVTNESDENYRRLATVTYVDGDQKRAMDAPAGDLFHQFRKDVQENKLPTVSWIVAPENFSDHPGAPWYGAWYISETLDILTQNPAVWKKTIFILCYDENDGYFDHVPPFVPPHPERPHTGNASAGLQTELEQVSMEQEREWQRNHPRSAVREGPIGLGYRVPLVIASPWSRGGYVCSEVFDHTSIVRFLERLMERRTNGKLRETNITPWRRAICGDLTSAFRPYPGEKIELPKPILRDPFLGSIHQAQFKPLPGGYRMFTEEEVSSIRAKMSKSELLPLQEPGTRPACPLPYELSVNGFLKKDEAAFVIEFGAGNTLFGARSMGAPYHVYTPARVRSPRNPATSTMGRTWAFAVAAGDRISHAWPISEFEGGAYRLCVNGPNGFFREFRGSAEDPSISVSVVIDDGGNRASLRVVNRSDRACSVLVEQDRYGGQPVRFGLGAAGSAGATVVIPLNLKSGWYDARLTVRGAAAFSQHYAGHLENGKESTSDPLIGNRPV